MTVLCGKCGTELLGAVNRCWRCGQPVVSRPDGAVLPPIRRPPVSGPLDVPPWAALPAVIVEEAPPIEAVAAENGNPSPPTAAPSAARRGSPFAVGAPIRRTSWIRRSRATCAAVLTLVWQSLKVRPSASGRTSPAPLVAALFGVALGGGSFSLGDYPEVALGIALVGMVAAIWGAISGARVVGAIAAVICMIALLWSGYGTASALYERVYGHKPFTEDEFDATDFETTMP